MRPRTLDEVAGQDHIVGPGRLLRRAIQADRLSSIIFYGPPGTGKTSLARVIANTTKSAFESLNAVLSGIKDIREAIDRSNERRRLYNKRTILFVDEVHRWNKAQQDALLPWVENGTVILVGATTENPFFEVNKALVSRSRIFQLKSLSAPDLLKTARRALADRERGYGVWRVSFEAGALEHLVEVSGGDARSLLNALELAVETSLDSWPPREGADVFISLQASEESIQRRAVLYDKEGDYHYDTISAFIKSVRGSDPDAALYWLAKMVRAGEDPAFIFRRMTVLASEDVGLADPQALAVVLSCAESFRRIGFPEGNYPLAHACLYLATAPKSNSAMAFFDALGEVEKEDAEVPNHLRDASRDAEGFGHGEGYVYPHAYRDHWAAQQYLPSSLKGKTFYMPSTSGYEGKIRDEVQRRREIQAAVILEEDDGQILSWSSSSKGRDGWYKRLEAERSGRLIAERDRIFAALEPSRHHRILVPCANDGLLLWEALRRAPEGLTAAVVDDEAAREALGWFAGTFDLDQTEFPKIAVLSETNGAVIPRPASSESLFGTPVFDRIALRWRGGKAPAIEETAEAAFNLLEKDGIIAVLASPPAMGQRLSAALAEFYEKSPAECPGIHGSGLSRFREADEDFFRPSKDPWTWDAGLVIKAFTRAGFGVSDEIVENKEDRVLTEADVERWFDREKSAWGRRMAGALGDEQIGAFKTALRRCGTVTWRWKSLFLRARR
jgi:putative ATPase